MSKNNSINEANSKEALYDVQSYLAQAIDHNTSMQSKKISNVLLTGANGFLGVHLLDEILKQSDATVYCAIRGKSKEHALEKLNEGLKQYSLKEHINNPRIKILLVDLAKERIGIDSKSWLELAALIDCIYHNGAYVHHLQSYQRMAPTNVQSVKELIKFASLKKIKDIHYISSKNATMNKVENIAHEGMPSIAPVHPDLANGYTTSKWAAEWILWKSHQQIQLPIHIYRLGQISGHSVSGQSNYLKNNLTRFIVGCIEMKLAPTLEVQHEMLPVDFVAKSLIKLSLAYRKNKACGWNIVHSKQRTHTELIEQVIKMGYDIKITSNNIWREKLKLVSKENKLHPLISYYDQDATLEFIQSKNERSIKALKDLEVGELPSEEDLLKKYFSYWKAQGFSAAL